MTGDVVLNCDGGSRGNPGPAAIGAVVVDPSTDPPTVLAEVSECIGVATNNVAEYRALIEGLKRARELRPAGLEIRADSELLVRQLQGRYRVRNAGLQPLYAEARRLLADFDRVRIVHVRREQNGAADALVNQALDAS